MKVNQRMIVNFLIISKFYLKKLVYIMISLIFLIQKLQTFSFMDFTNLF